MTDYQALLSKLKIGLSWEYENVRQAEAQLDSAKRCVEKYKAQIKQLEENCED